MLQKNFSVVALALGVSGISLCLSWGGSTLIKLRRVHAQAAALATHSAPEQVPVEILSVEPQQPTASGLIPYRATIRNNGSRPVMAFTINWRTADPITGQITAKRGVCATTASFDYDRPALRLADTKTIDVSLRPPVSRVDASLDLVLNDDGTTYGQDACRELEIYQNQFITKRSTQKQVLTMLQTAGSAQTEQYLREQIAKAPQDRQLLTSKRVSVR